MKCLRKSPHGEEPLTLSRDFKSERTGEVIMMVAAFGALFEAAFGYASSTGFVNQAGSF